MRGLLILFGVVLMLFFIAGCAPPAEDLVPVKDEVVPEGEVTVTVEEKEEVMEEKEEVMEEKPQPTGQEPTAEVKELLGKHTTIKSVQYIIDDGTPDAVTVYLKGDNYKKDIFRTRYGDEQTYYENVYVDRDARTAYTHCAKGAICPEDKRNKAFFLEFANEDIQTPLQMIQGVTFAEEVGTEKFANRDTIILEYTNAAGKRERLWVDTFYGMPLQQRIYEGEVMVEKHTFTKVAFNTLKDDDVTLPDKYEID